VVDLAKSGIIVEILIDSFMIIAVVVGEGIWNRGYS
jgi:hypothetical protein